VTALLPPDSIGAVLHQRLGALVADLHVRDEEVRDRVPDGVHQARVTSRRLRSALATFRPVLVREVTEPIRDDLRWLSLGLSDARDAEVVRARLRDVVASEVGRAEQGQVSRRVDAVLQELARAAEAEVDTTLGAHRYHALLGSLDRLVAHPPWSEAAARPAEKILAKRLRRERRRLDKRARRAAGLRDDPAAFDVAVHDMRKAAKRLRYAYEVAEPVLGEPERRVAARRLTKLLGERQDAVLTRDLLPRIEAAAASAGEDTEVYGRLQTSEAQRAAGLADDALRCLGPTV
jgi:CHAD domain-containing protein